MTSIDRLKVYIQILNGKQVFSNENSPFKIDDKDLMPSEICNFLNRKQEKIPLTYIVSVVNSNDQKIIKKGDKFDKDKYENSHLSTHFDVLVPKASLFEVTHFFECSGIDLIYSPFDILLRYIEENNSHPTLDLLICDDVIYAMIYDKEQVLYSATTKITTKGEIQNSDFYNTHEESNTLFAQMYYLELSEFLIKSLEEFSKSKDAKFIEKINILYIDENLNKTQINDMSSELLLEISYEKIAFLEELNELAKEDVL
jgi:hypothetical protein